MGLFAPFDNLKKKKSSTVVKNILLKSFARAIDVLGHSIFCSIKSNGVSVVTS